MTIDDEENRALFEIASRRLGGTFEYAEDSGMIIYRRYNGHLHRAAIALVVVPMPGEIEPLAPLPPMELPAAEVVEIPEAFRKAFEEA